MGGVDVGVGLVAALAGELVSSAFAELAAPAAALGGVGGVYVADGQAVALSPVHTRLRHLVVEPLRQLTAGACALLAAFADLLDRYSRAAGGLRLNQN